MFLEYRNVVTWVKEKQDIDIKTKGMKEHQHANCRGQADENICWVLGEINVQLLATIIPKNKGGSQLQHCRRHIVAVGF